jgi:glycosyltransferase involved in cell wall biosynthesis
VSALKVGFVLHVMHVAGAEVLVAETIRRLGNQIDPVVFCLDAVGPLGEKLRAEGVEVHVLGRRPGVDPGVVVRLASLIRSTRTQVLHTHQYTPFFYGSLATKLAWRGTRVIFTEHGRHYPDVVSRKRRALNRTILRRLAHRVTAVCAFSATALAERDGFDGTPIDIIENGIDLERYGPPADRAALKRSLGLPADRRHVVCVARFHPVKDHQTLVRAFADVARARPDVDLLLVGDGPLRGDLEALAGELGLASRVRFLGVRSDVPSLLAASDVFALASLSEAASITLLEAMASGTPVVVTDVGGNPEMVRPGVEGVLTPRGDAGAMAAALGRVLDDPSEAARRARKASERVAETYRLSRTIDRYATLYRELSGSDKPD